jgi:uncharacterized membrane protein
MAAQRGFDRLVNLSDAVVAIASTLLVLPLVDSASEISGSSVGELLAGHGEELLAFGLSFAVICRFWLVHHTLFTRVTGFTPALVWVNFLWLLSIAFLPFPTELVSFAGEGSRPTSTLYVGTMLLTSVASTLMQLIIVRHPEIQAEDVRGTLRARGAVVATATMAVVLLVVVLVPHVGLFALLLLIPSGVVEGRIARRSDAATPAGTRAGPRVPR